MQYSVPVEGFTDDQIILETAGFFSGPKLLLNGEPAQRGEKRGQYVLPRDDGSEITLKLKNVFFDPVPQIVTNEDQVIKVIEPLKWYQWVWSSLPILLVFMGGAIGAIFGLIAASISIRVFRSQMNTAVQYIVVAVISIIAVIAYVILAMLIASLL